MSSLKKYSWLISLVVLIALIVLFVNSDRIFHFKLPSINDPYSNLNSNLLNPKNENPVNQGIELTNNPDGPLLEEYSDFQCPYCEQAYPIVKYLRAKYNGKINFQYKHLPNVQSHKNALDAANAAECAKDQEKFEQYHDTLFENQNSLDRESLFEYAEDLGLDIEKFKACFNSAEKIPIIQNDLDEGLARGTEGTPTFYLNGKFIYLDQIDKELEKLIKN